MIRIIFPVSRIVGGSVHKLTAVMDNTTKLQKVDKNGKPRFQVNFGIAIPKEDQPDWKLTSWGAEMLKEASTTEPVRYRSASYAYKIIDGDSDIPNGAGKVPCELEGYAGHWILWFSQGWAPKLMDATGKQAIAPENFVNGYYVQIIGDVKGNGAKPNQTPGLFMNPVMACLVAPGEVIASASDVDTSSLTAAGAASQTANAMYQTAQKPVPSSVVKASSGPLVFPPVQKNTDSGATTSVEELAKAVNADVLANIKPNTSFLGTVVHKMLPASNGCTYEAMIAEGWTDALMIEHKMMES